jgi:hypothetical protein
MVGSSVGGNSVGLSESGYFYFPGPNGVMWRGYAQVGNAKLVNSTWVGWQKIDNTTISVTKYYFTYDILVYTVNTPNDIIPYSATTMSYLQYQWSHFGMFGDQIGLQLAFIKIPCYTLPANWAERLTSELNLDVKLEFEMNPALFGQGLDLTFNDENGTYSAVGFSVTSFGLNADPNKLSTSGFVSQPTIAYDSDVFGVSPGNANVSATLPAPTTSSVLSESLANNGIKIALNDADGLAGMQHFTVTQVNSEKASSTSKMASMLTPGLPVTVYADEAVADLSQTKLTGTMPFLLQPGTTISQTQTTYKRWYVASADHFLADITYGASYTTMNPMLPTLVNTNNVWAIQRGLVGIDVATNYTWDPFQLSYTPDIEGPPTINGTDGSVNPLPTDHVTAAGGNLPVNPWNLLGWLMGNWYWLLIAGIAVIVVVFVWKFVPSSGSKGGGKETNVNIYTSKETGEYQRGKSEPVRIKSPKRTS